jgi:hypothetical protein
MTTPRPTPMRDLALRGLIDATAVLDGEVSGNELIAIGQAAFWACAVDEHMRDHIAKEAYESRRQADPNGRVLPGLRFIRNAVAHGAVVVTRSSGLVWPLGSSPSGKYFDWGELVYQSRGVVVDEWIGTRDRNRHIDEQDRIHDELFGGRPVAEPLHSAIAWFSWLSHIGWDMDRFDEPRPAGL